MTRDYLTDRVTYSKCYSTTDVKGVKLYKVPLFFVFEEGLAYDTIVDYRKTPCMFPSRIRVKPQFKLRPHQTQIHPHIMKGLQTFPYHACTIQKSCGAGKTIQAAHTIAKLGVKTMICVPQSKLADQFKKEIQLVMEVQEEDICCIGSVFKDTNYDTAWIFICVYNSMRQTRKQPTKFPDLVRSCDFLVVDEAHRFPAKANTTILKNYHGKYRMALTATPTRESDGLGHMIFKLLGPIVAKVDREKPPPGLYQARVLEYYNPAHAQTLYLPKCGKRRKPDRSKMLKRICEDEVRCRAIAEFVARDLKSKFPLLLGDWKSIVYTIAAEIEKRLPDSTCTYVGGNESKKKRIKTQHGLIHARFIVATTAKAGEGMDIKRLNCVVFLTPRTPGRLLIQTTGRMLRKREPKFVYYISDIATEYWTKRTEKCMTWFRRQGFQVMPPRSIGPLRPQVSRKRTHAPNSQENKVYKRRA